MSETKNKKSLSILIPPPEAPDDEMKTPHIKFYHAYQDALDLLGDEESGLILRGMVAYYEGKEPPKKMSRFAKSIFGIIKLVMDQDELIWLYQQREKHVREKEERKAE